MWSELKRLEQCCEVTLRSYLDSNGKLFWRAIVVPRANPQSTMVTESAEIQDAVRMAVEKAQQAGLLSK